MWKPSRSAIFAVMFLASYPLIVDARTSTVAGLKSAADCTAEYKANKGALKDAKEKKGDFITACRALPPGTPTPIGTAAAQPAAPAPTQTAAPTPSKPAPDPLPPRSSAPATTAAPGESACGEGYAHLPTSHTRFQFCEEAQAKARCPGQPVVWVNTKSKIFHVAGSNTYGHTKEGAYMCQEDAITEGDRLSKNGH